MTFACLDVSKWLTDLIISTTMLPIATVENTIVDFALPDSGDLLGSISAPSSVAASGVVLTPQLARVLAGHSAIFTLTPNDSTPQRKHHPCVLTALASATVATVILRNFRKGDIAVDTQLPVDIETSAELNCVLLTVAVPPGTPDGSLVIINNVWVAGCAVALNETTSSATVGFNHTLAPNGAVFKAAKVGDVPGIMAALHNGGSTNERGDVSLGKQHIETIGKSSDRGMLLLS
jgi:hypothetical protein